MSGRTQSHAFLTQDVNHPRVQHMYTLCYLPVFCLVVCLDPQTVKLVK
jgi:hypothetical protein